MRNRGVNGQESNPLILNSAERIRKRSTMEGTVKFFKEKPGWGFIEGEDGVDRFVHYSEIQMSGFRKLQKGDRVSYEVGTGQDGRVQALNVVVITPTD